MAEASFEASYVNIKTAGTSSHPKIEPEIQVVESTGDSDVVCGLEKKKCDEIMEHLKNNPGLVVKSLDPEGRTMLHVTVMVGETKKPKPPTSKHTDKGLSEAVVDSEWYRALEERDCKALMSLLQRNPFLVAQTGAEGWTVLHAAADMGCLQLLDQVVDLFYENNRFVDEMSGVHVGWNDLRKAKCGMNEAEAWHLAWFTCPPRVWEDLRRGRIQHGHGRERFSSMHQSNSDASQHLRDKLSEIMQGEHSKEAFKDLERRYQEDTCYNFVPEHKELQFHLACGNLFFSFLHAEDYVKTIIKACQDLKPLESVEVLKYLFQLHNAQGQTPFFASLGGVFSHHNFTKLLELLPEGDDYKECLNAKDVRRWTILHYVVATKNYDSLKVLLEDGRIDVNTRTPIIYPYGEPEEGGMTALHLAILHEDVRSVELLLQYPHVDVNALFFRHILYDYKRMRREQVSRRDRYERSYWSPLQLATIMGLSDVVRALLVTKRCDIDNDGKLPSNDFQNRVPKMSSLLLASTSGNPATLRLFLDPLVKFDPLVKYEGATALHYTTNAIVPMVDEEFPFCKIGQFLRLTDLGELDRKIYEYEEESKDLKWTPTLYRGRQACITMLLQAGVDTWEKDEQGRFAEPGPRALGDVHLWWHDKIAQETLEAKKSLNDAANAISVVAALVATASFVGPLQPPLGYGGDSLEGGGQDTYLSIRVFMVSNILSFYLAVASIMFAVVPSLLMPQEGIYAEWQRTKRTVGVAIFFLLLSVIGVLISFGAASNSVVSEDYSWRHNGLSFYPTIVGGLVCILGISLFFLRLLRLVFNKNATIRYLYKKFVKF